MRPGLGLYSPVGDVVDDRVSRDVTEGLLFGYVLGCASDNHREFGFIVDVIRRDLRDQYVGARMVDAGAGLHEEIGEGLGTFRGLLAFLLDVFGVIPRQKNDLLRCGEGCEQLHFARPEGHAFPRLAVRFQPL